MILRTDSKYPIHRSYVVKLCRDATRDVLRGRIESLVTGTDREFSTAQELLGLICGDIDSLGVDAPGAP